MLVYNHIDLNDYQIQNLKVHVKSTAPTAAQGQLYLDSTSTFLRYHNGTTWVDIKNNYLATGDNISELVNDSGYLTSYTETDPVFLAHVAYGITSLLIGQWNTAYSWGDHATAGYLTSFSEVDTLDTVTSRGATTANNLTVGDLTISGNLVVSGTTTTINTETIELADNIITLNSNATGAATENAGLLIERGDDTNRGFRWNESSNVWEIQKDDNLYYEIEVVDTTGKIKAQTLSDTATVTHNFDTRDVSVEMYDTVTYQVYKASWVATTTSLITVTFYETPTNPIRVLVTKQEAA